MSGEIEFGYCDMCSIQAPLNRKYYKYDIICDCCNHGNDNHFECVNYCNNCHPRPPHNISVYIQPQLLTKDKE